MASQGLLGIQRFVGLRRSRGFRVLGLIGRMEFTGLTGFIGG